ncbi:DUF4192 domain-containing protein [Streptacidiphilus sp. PB12-B1b]|uniref:DUF4192 domain-containing protein n=1 Tax=Streptacidiphilus sp. PB12-B1b TaxID=2705012 RepID=UPI0015F80D9B|nr:DUF4192 domain-containing protein [Streptacidiphilus sp. PB12-B1b]QMU78727.1 DUF4192 domain-containing protein [Streptacidiphilus sp. PB12-B1b]
MNEHAPAPASSFEHPVVRMRTPADMVDALPYLLGFFPSDSVVALGLQGPRRRQGGTVRIDLPTADAWPAAAEEVARFLVALSEHRDRSPDAVILYLCRDPAPGQQAAAVAEELRPLAEQLTAAFAAVGIPVHEALCVSGGRWWSFSCRDPRCCDPGGTPVDRPGTTSTIAAAAAYAGVRVRGSLKELQRELDPVGAPTAESQLAAFEQAVPALVEELLRSGGREAVRERTAELVDAAVAAFRAGAEELPEADAARLILGLQDRMARDRAAEWLDPPDVEPAQRLWRFLARRCAVPFDSHAAAPLALLGWTAWVTGDQVTARIALGRALVADPDYTFAQLLHEAVNSGAEPRSLCATLRAERRARQRRSRRRPERRRVLGGQRSGG